ncbi:MAG: GNAT family N-acetyltransferase [Congregibacter sp.]
MARLRLLEVAWRELHQGDPDATPFQTFTWTMLWLSSYEFLVDSPWIVLCYRDEQLVGVIPLYRRKVGALGLGIGMLAFIGSGEPESCESCAEYLDVLCLDGYKDVCTNCFHEAIVAARGVSGVEFSRMFAERVDAMAGPLGRDFTISEQRPAGRRFLVSTDGAHPNLQLSRRTLSALRRKKRRFFELPGAQLRYAENADSLTTVFDALISLHQRRWEVAGQKGVFDSALFTTFHRRFAQDLLDDAQLLLFCLEVEGRPVTAHYCILSKTTCFFYQSGVDTEAYSNLSLGSVAHLIAIEHSVERGIAFYDLMAGAEKGYKRRFVEPCEPLLTREIYRGRGGMLLNKASRRFGHSGL